MTFEAEADLRAQLTRVAVHAVGGRGDDATPAAYGVQATNARRQLRLDQCTGILRSLSGLRTE